MINPEQKEPQDKNLDRRIELLTGDITDIEADAIVCPSLPDLDVLYSGVAGAIMRKGGDEIFAEARAIGKKAMMENPKARFPVPLCSAHITNGGKLPKAKHVIHSVAVDYIEDKLGCDPAVIFKSAWNVLEVADKNHLKSLAFPALGAGLYAVPLDQSFGAIAQAADKYLKEHSNTSLKSIKLVSRDANIPQPSLMEDLEIDRLARSGRNRQN